MKTLNNVSFYILDNPQKIRYTDRQINKKYDGIGY